MKPEDLTVVVPTRNEARNIVPFLKSLPEEISLVVVDASEDETPDLILSHRKRRTRVVIRDSSVTEARQIGADIAETRWILFTDADVEFASDYFGRLSDCDPSDAAYGPKLSREEFKTYYRWFARGQRLADWFHIPAASGSNLLIRRRVLMAVGGFDMDLTCNDNSIFAREIDGKSA